MSYRLQPSVARCLFYRCPDLDEITINDRSRRVCGAAFNRIPGNLSVCPTGYLDRAYDGARADHSDLELGGGGA